MKILVVDDEIDVKLLFEQRFRKERKSGQLNMSFAHSGEEALVFLEEGGTADIALILSDINMPGMNGLQLLKILREKYKDLTVYMITAYGDENNRKQAEEYGANDYLTKPLDFKDLKERIFKEDTH